jgi:hypothetical protein
MTSYTQLVTLAQTLTEQAAAYATKPTKAESKRMRLTIAAIQRLAVDAKRNLIAADQG